jgi:DNA-binding response OmpR family regulator
MGTADATRGSSTNSRILVVDDEVSMVRFVAEALEICGYGVGTADSGFTAFRELQNNRYDLVLTDFNMPNGSGGDLVVKMRAEQIHVPVIIMTGSALSKEMITMGAMLKVAALMSKPFTIDELVQAVESVLQPGNASAGATPAIIPNNNLHNYAQHTVS